MLILLSKIGDDTIEKEPSKVYEKLEQEVRTNIGLQHSLHHILSKHDKDPRKDKLGRSGLDRLFAEIDTVTFTLSVSSQPDYVTND